MIHIGSKIKEIVKQRGITTVEFAEHINYSRRNVYSIFKKESIDTDLLVRISEFLEYNFFEEYTSYVKAIYNIEDKTSLVNESWDNMMEYKKENTLYKKQVEELSKEVSYLKEINALLRKKD